MPELTYINNNKQRTVKGYNLLQYMLVPDTFNFRTKDFLLKIKQTKDNDTVKGMVLKRLGETTIHQIHDYTVLVDMIRHECTNYDKVITNFNPNRGGMHGLVHHQVHKALNGVIMQWLTLFLANREARDRADKKALHLESKYEPRIKDSEEQNSALIQANIDLHRKYKQLDATTGRIVRNFCVLLSFSISVNIILLAYIFSN